MKGERRKKIIEQRINLDQDPDQAQEISLHPTFELNAITEMPHEIPVTRRTNHLMERILMQQQSSSL